MEQPRNGERLASRWSLLAVLGRRLRNGFNLASLRSGNPLTDILLRAASLAIVVVRVPRADSELRNLDLTFRRAPLSSVDQTDIDWVHVGLTPGG
jgi:hypothetical protein